MSFLLIILIAPFILTGWSNLKTDEVTSLAFNTSPVVGVVGAGFVGAEGAVASPNSTSLSAS